jgi:hypothetical protein
MKIPFFLLVPFLVIAIGSCTSETDQGNPKAKQLDQGGGKETEEDNDGAYVDSEYPRKDTLRKGPWNVADDDNRTRLDACYLTLQEDVNATSLTVFWQQPANAPRPPLYHLEIAEGNASFAIGYRSYPNVKGTRKSFQDLEPNKDYYVSIQAYFEKQAEADDNSSRASSFTSFAPSEREVVSTTTKPNVLDKPSKLEIIVQNGRFSATWDAPQNASGKLEYVVTVYTDEELKGAVNQLLVKENKIENWIVPPEFDYWLSVRALPDPDSTNRIDSDSEQLVEKFFVPGNRLDVPANFKIVKQEDLFRLSWDPVKNNLENFEYLLQVHLDENRTEQFGEYHLNATSETLSGVNQNNRYWFDLQAIPLDGNYVDAPSETISEMFEIPVLTYATPVIGDVRMEEIDDPEEPATLVTISWGAIANADGKNKFRVEIAEDEDFTTGYQENEADASARSGEYGPLDHGKTYYIRMQVRGPDEDATRHESEWSTVKSFSTPPLQVEPVAPETEE